MYIIHYFGEREGFEPRVPKGYTAFRVQRIQPDSAISPYNVLNYREGNYYITYRITTR